jgi:Carboxypeptidase regulatory-like domain
MPSLLFSSLLITGLSLAAATCAQETRASQAQQQSQQQQTGTAVSSAAEQQPDRELNGSISGTVVDQSGTPIAGARVRLTHPDRTPAQEVSTDDGGQFFFVNISPGPFQLTITAAGFAPQTVSGTLHPGEAYTDPRIALAVATVITQVRVGPAVAEEQIKQEEQQRVLGVVPNFYVTYLPNAVPLSAKQKFELAWKTSVDPVTFGLVGAIAGVQQAQNDFSGYGQGAQGYGKRYGASYGDTVIGTFIGGAVLPSLFKQDPRFFYKGSGSMRSRIFYAVAASVICKGDNGHWQASYSNILGSLAAGGISNLYYPSQNRNGLELTFENALIGIGEGAGANLLQEFVIPKLTPKKSSNSNPPQP